MRAKVLVFQGLMVILVLLAFGLNVVLFVHQGEINSWRERQTEAAQFAAKEISTSLNQVKEALRLLTSLTQENAAADIDLLAKVLESFPDVLEIVYVDRTGQVMAITSQDTPQLPFSPKITREQWFQTALSGREFQSAPYLYSKKNSYLILAFKTADGNVIAARLGMKLLWNAAAQIRIGETGHAYIIDGNGRVIAHSNPRIVFDKEYITDLPGPLALLRSPGSWVMKYDDLEGTSVVGASASIEGTDWVLITELETQEAYATSRHAAFLTGGGILLFGILGLMISSRMLRRMVLTPIEQLRLGADQIGRNHLSYRIDLIAHDELAQVADAFNRMASRLEERERQVSQQTAILTAEIAERRRAEEQLLELNEDLENRVEERTAQLTEMNAELRREINERERAEAALRKSEERWRDYIEQANDLIFILDAEGKFKSANRELCKLTGYQPEEIIGHSPAEFIHPDSLPTAMAALTRIFEGGNSDQETIEIIAKDGRQLLLEVRGRSFYQDGRLEETLHTARDITERKKSEEEMQRAHAALQESEARMRALFASMQDVVIVYDSEGRYRLIPSTNTNLLYMPPQSMLGKTVTEVLPEEQAKLILDYIQRAISTQETVAVEYSLEIDGRQIWFSGAITPMQDDRVILVAHDITDRKQAEEEIRRRTAQLEALRQIGLEVTAELDLNELLHSITKAACDLLDADSSGLYLYRPEQDVLEQVIRTDDGLLPFGKLLRKGEGLSGKVWEAGQPLIENYGGCESCSPGIEQNVIGVPVRWGSIFLGVLIVASGLKRQFDQKDVELLSLFATQAAIAIRNAQTIKNEERQRARAEAMVRAGAALDSSLNLNELLDKLLAVTASAIQGAERGLVFLAEEGIEDLYVHAAVGYQDERVQKIHIPGSEVEKILAQSGGKPVLIPAAVSSFLNKKEELEERSAVQSTMLCPIFGQGKLIGFITLENLGQKEPFLESDLALLEAFAGQAALAIEKARLYQRVSTSEERYALAVRGANDGLWDWDLRSDTVYYSPRWKVMLGFEDAEIGSSPDEWLDRIHMEDVERVKADIEAHLRGETPHFESEHRIRRKDGTFRWVLARGLAVCEAGMPPHRLAGSLTDTHQRKATEERLRHDALHDGLTQLPNRVYFIDQLNRAMERAKRKSDYLAAVLFLDLDRFKLINDSLGHEAGDLLLISIARRLEACLRHGDMVARFGGDEFAILIDPINSLNDAILVAERVQSTLASPMTLQDHEVSTTASMGIALVTPGYKCPEDLIRDVDTAMYRAKAKGRSRYEVFNAEMHLNSMAMLELELDLRRGLERQEFELYYQPIVQLESGQPVGAEALLRWRHPERGLLSPAEFLTILEETGMVVPVGEWVLRKACLHARQWRENGFPFVRVSVNLSARQLDLLNLPEIVQRVLDETGLEPSGLELEITESSAMRDIDQTVQTLRQLKTMGVRLAIDDFGQSYSSLGYLKRFPVNTLKIDKSFVQGLSAGFDDSIILTAIIAMAHILQLQVVAEGVETQEQYEFLLPQCDEVQGRYISSALPFEELLEWLRIKTPLFHARQMAETY